MKAIVVGAGVAGLMSALRLTHEGYEVTIFDTRKCGSGSSTKNQGMIHSGAMYANLHPEVVPLCMEAQDLFKNHFGSAQVLENTSLYYGSVETMQKCIRQWKSLQIKYSAVDASDAERYFLDTQG